MERVRKNLEQVEMNIQKAAHRSGRNPGDITLVAVTKKVDADTAEFIHQLGIKDLGESKVQQLKVKQESISDVNWHLIGRLQTNKVKEVVGRVALVHSMDRWKLAEELNHRGELIGAEIPVLLQVNIAGEEQKAGVQAGEVKDFLDSVGQLEKLKIYGFMTMAPLLSDVEEARPVFRELFQLREKFRNQQYRNVELKYLSMGMSQDYEIAIEEGADIVRIGSAIFGEQ